MECLPNLGGSARPSPAGRADIHGRLRFDFDDGTWTMIYYYNKPSKHIPTGYNKFYKHHTLPAYLVIKNNTFYVGTYDELYAHLSDDMDKKMKNTTSHVNL